MVFQNVYLFHDTVRTNILFGRPDATEAEMIEAAKKAHCHDFIIALPQGYDTVIGEGGGTLSGGEKLRISIARAILYFVTGQFTVLLLITFAVACILSEVYRAITKYDNRFIHMAISFILFCYGMLGSPIDIWVYKDSFLSQIQLNSMSAEYVESLSGLIYVPMLITLCVSPIVGGTIGALIAKGLFRKHFRKTGMGQKKLLILDEPTSGLDFRHMCQVTERMKQLAQKGYILFVVAHDYEFLNRACNGYIQIEKQG